jgi:hypothetical protein
LEIKSVKCARKRAWEYIDMGKITVHGQIYEIELFNPSVDPLAEYLCKLENKKRRLCVSRHGYSRHLRKDRSSSYKL